MTVDFQVIIDIVSQIFIVSFPFALVFWLVGKVTNFFLCFVFNKEVKI